jgi:hypothetical protein
MIFCIVSDADTKFFTSIITSLKWSLIDIGHKEGTLSNSELIIAIKNFPRNLIKEKHKIYWLIQTEQLCHKPIQIQTAYDFNPTKIFGFDINNKKENYLVIGYHPKLEVKSYSKISTPEISLLGAETKRRIEFKQKVQNKFEFIRQWNYNKRIEILKNTTINLNVHSYSNNKFTEWERIIPMISNKCFFITESIYCPIKGIINFNLNEYDSIIEKYFKNEKVKREICEQIYDDYINNFDMRKILEKLI